MKRGGGEGQEGQNSLRVMVRNPSSPLERSWRQGRGRVGGTKGQGPWKGRLSEAKAWRGSSRPRLAQE